jgi:hypothetical protein
LPRCYRNGGEVSLGEEQRSSLTRKSGSLPRQMRRQGMIGGLAEEGGFLGRRLK